MHIYCFATQRICYANWRSLEFWDADNAEELYARALTPHNHATEARLAEYLDAFERGENRHETWTFYPKGIAIAKMCHCRGVAIDGHAKGMLVEIEAPSQSDLPSEELRALEALRLTPLMISLYSKDGRVLMRNPAALDRFRSLDASLPESSDKFRATFDEADVAEAVMNETLTDHVVWKTARIAVAGRPIHRLQVLAVKDPATGEPARLVAQEDISEIVHASSQLVASQEAFDIFLNLNFAPTLIFSAVDASVLVANEVATQLFGARSTGDIRADELFGPKDEYVAFARNVVTYGTATAQLDLTIVDDMKSKVLVTGGRIVYAGRDAIILMLAWQGRQTDETAELVAALGAAQSNNASQRRLLKIASHDLRTALAVIDTSAQRLERRAQTHSAEEVRARGSRIRGMVRNILSILDGTIDRARRDTGKIDFLPERHDLAETIAAVVETVHNFAPQLQVEMDLGPLPPMVFDRTLIERAFSNLLANTCKYAQGQPRVRIGSRCDHESVRIFVRDWGPGIPEREQAHIFKEEFRGVSAQGTEGLGLGLAIVRQVIEAHNGSIHLVETDGPGSTFVITLPREMHIEAST